MTTVMEVLGSQDAPAGIVTIAPEDTVVTAARTMRQHNIGCLVVADADGRITGIISERDITGRVVARLADPAKTLVRDVMTNPVVTCAREASLTEVQGLMHKCRIRHVAVVDHGIPVGMVSTRQIVARQLVEEGEMRNVAMLSLAKLAESRDPETGAHLERVREFTRILALRLSRLERYADCLDQRVVELMRVTSVLHDIGKVGIPDSVLLKPGRLDETEFEIMKTHAEIGARTLELALQVLPDADFLRMARDIAGFHHERFDGKGYPCKLAGERIPLPARIFAVADVYDALVSKRVYKKAFTHTVAKNIIIEGKGTQFDPDVVQAFLECQEEFHIVACENEDYALAVAVT